MRILISMYNCSETVHTHRGKQEKLFCLLGWPIEPHAFWLRPGGIFGMPQKEFNTTGADILIAALLGDDRRDVDFQRRESIEERRSQFTGDAKALRQRLALMNWGLLDPRSKFVQYWDICSMVFLLYTAFVTPFEVCLGIKTELNLLFALNSVVNLFFLGDLVVNFVLPYQSATGFVRSHIKIAKRYLRSWFIIDVLSILPFDTMDATGAFNDETPVDPTILKSVRIIRLFRLLRLMRVLRASRIISRWENSIGLTSSFKSLVFYAVLLTMVLHW